MRVCLRLHLIEIVSVTDMSSKHSRVHYALINTQTVSVLTMALLLVFVCVSASIVLYTVRLPSPLGSVSARCTGDSETWAWQPEVIVSSSMVLAQSLELRDCVVMSASSFSLC